LFLLGLIESLSVAWELPFFRGPVGQSILGQALVWSGGIGIAAALSGWGSIRGLCYPLGPSALLGALILNLGLGCIRGSLACLLGIAAAGSWPSFHWGSGLELPLYLALGVVVECATPPTWSRVLVYLGAFSLLQPLLLRGQPGTWLWLGPALTLGLVLCLLGGLRLWAPLAPRR
jgi:hypothetical protein